MHFIVRKTMTEAENNLLAVFEEKIQDLIKLCDDRRRYIEELEMSLKAKEQTIQQEKQKVKALEFRYISLLTARRLAENESELKNARKQVCKLVREVDTCIALLNE